MGDGGSANIPVAARRIGRCWLGKILRIDVDHGVPYAIRRHIRCRQRDGARDLSPSACAIRGASVDARPAISTSGDVGQDNYEEIDRWRRAPARARTSAGA